MDKNSRKKIKLELRSKTIPELIKLLRQEQKELVKLKMDLKIGKLKDIKAPFKKRKMIAVIKTIIREQQLKELNK